MDSPYKCNRPDGAPWPFCYIPRVWIIKVMDDVGHFFNLFCIDKSCIDYLFFTHVSYNFNCKTQPVCRDGGYFMEI